MRGTAFISYSHKDAQYHDELLLHLKPLERFGRAIVWSDEQIRAGSQWASEIEQALAEAHVVVLLVSKWFLASDFIHEKEFTPLLEAARQNGVTVLWVLIGECNWKMTPLQDFQAAFSPERPLAAMTESERDAAWVGISEVIDKALRPGGQD